MFTSCVRTGTPQPSPAHGRLPGPSPTRPPAAASRPAFRCSGSSTQRGEKLNLKLPHTRDFLPVLLILGTATPPSTTPRRNLEAMLVISSCCSSAPVHHND